MNWILKSKTALSGIAMLALALVDLITGLQAGTVDWTSFTEKGAAGLGLIGIKHAIVKSSNGGK